jgi:serine phosphatase RsbU (regulator of sigma subunit)
MTNCKEHHNNQHKTTTTTLIIAFSVTMCTILLLINLLLSYEVGLHWPTILTLIFGALLTLSASLLVKFNKFTLAKFFIIIVPPYTLLIVSLLTKSNDLISNVYTYLIPRLFVNVYIMFPIMFFGLRLKKKLVLSIFLLMPSFLMFDYFHELLGVNISALPYDHSYYSVFIQITSLFCAFVIISLLFFKKSNNLFRNRIKKEIAQIETLNDQLQLQSNLYAILEITSKNKKLIFTLQEVLENILSSDSLYIGDKGVVFLKNTQDKLEIAAHKNVDSLLKSKAKRFFNSVGHNLTINPDELESQEHYIVPIKLEGKVYGVINIYIEDGESHDPIIEGFLEGVALILARRIKGNIITEKLVQTNIEFKSQGLILNRILSELNDSIAYAHSLQKTFIPNQETIDGLFDEGCFLYKPKDFVSGDFYFAHNTGENIYFGIGDCTGHGIPGSLLAAMSVEAVKTTIVNNVNKKPDEILTKLRAAAKDRFSINSDQERSDAMDAALCMFARAKNKLYFSGGFISLLIVRNNNELIEFKPTRCPIGGYPVEHEFELNEIELIQGDVLYLATDGYVDQFGIDKESDSNKAIKFKRNRFRKLLISISHLTVKDQVKALDKTIEDWKGNQEQVDDITVFILRHH